VEFLGVVVIVLADAEDILGRAGKRRQQLDGGDRNTNAVISFGKRVDADKSTIVLDSWSCTPIRAPRASEKVTRRIQFTPR
jgi:hypothetical protein